MPILIVCLGGLVGFIELARYKNIYLGISTWALVLVPAFIWITNFDQPKLISIVVSMLLLVAVALSLPFLYRIARRRFEAGQKKPGSN